MSTTANKPNKAERSQSITAANFLDIPNLTNLCERWSFPPWNGEAPRRNLENTATDVSRIGTARINTGIEKDPKVVSTLGFYLMVSVARSTPKNKDPASPMYIFAGDLFQTRNPNVAPATTTERAETNV